MLTLDRPRQPLDRTLLTTAGGFAWWYVDALSASGDGLVCIWSWGLPFLPDQATAWREGRPYPTRARPSVNLVVYQAGRPTHYHLQALAPEAAHWQQDRWDAGRWQMGDSTFLLQPDGEGRATLRADLDLPVPGSPDRLRGHFAVTGPLARQPDTPAGRGVHVWAPILGPATLSAELRHGAAAALIAHDLPAYHDRNGSPTALDDLGLDHWIWGRATVAGQLVIFYLSYPTDPSTPPFLLLSHADEHGRYTVTEGEVQLDGRQRAAFGMPWWTTLRLTGLPEPLTITVHRPIDDGPFYLRAAITARYGGAEGIGWAELCRPDRVDRPLLRPLVNMCVQRSAGDESLWLPLFSGPRAGRWGRLLRWWTTGIGAGQPPALTQRSDG